MTTPAAQPRPGRHWRIVRHVAGALMLLVCLAVLGLLWALRHLDTSVIKGRLRALVRQESGLELDYATAKADLFSGLSLRDVTIASPPDYREVAPTLLHLGTLNLGWSLLGRGPTLRRLSARDVELTVVVDERGATSLDTLSKNKAATAPATPGERLGLLLRSLPDFDRLDFSSVTVRLIQTRGGHVVARSRLGRLELRAESRGEAGARHVELALGEKWHPLALAVSHEADGKSGFAGGKLWLEAGIDARTAALHGELTVDHQSLSPAWPKRGVLFAVDAMARAEGDRLRVALDRCEAVTGAMVARGAIELAPGRTRVDAARGTMDLTRLAQLLPPGRLPLALREGHIKYDVAGLELQPAPRLDAGGHLDLDGRAADVRWLRGADRVELDAVRLVVRGRPLPDGGLQLAADVPAGELTLAFGRQRIALSHAESALKATLPAAGPGQIEVRTHFDALSTVTAGAGGATVRATRGQLETRLAELRIDAAQPARSSGALSIAYAVDSFEARLGGVTSRGSGVKLVAHARRIDGAPDTAEIDLPIARLAISGARDGVIVPAGAAHLSARIDRPHFDVAAPRAWTGKLHAQASLAGFALVAAVEKLPDAAVYEVKLDADRASLLTAFAPPPLALPGARMALALAANGRVDGLSGTPRLRQHATLHVTNPAITLAEQLLAAASLDLAVDSDGSARRQEAKVTLTERALALDDEKLGDGTLSAKSHWDLGRSTFDLALDGKGEALPSGHLALAAAFDHATRVVDYRIDGDLGHLAALEPLLPETLTDEHWLDLSDVRARISSHGHLGGIVTGVDGRGLPLLAARPLAALRGDDQLDLAIERLHYVDAAGVELTVPSLSLTTRVHGEADERRADVELTMPRATLLARGHRFDVTALRDQVQAHAVGDPLIGVVEVAHTLAIGKLVQDVLPLYPIGNLTQVTHARRSADGTIDIDDFTVTNATGGTRLSLHGGLTLARAVSHRQPRMSAGNGKKSATRIGTGTDEGPESAGAPVGFSSLQLGLDLVQRLDALVGDPGRFHGGGSVDLVADLASGDLRRFHVASSVRFHEASLELPTRHIRVANLDGILPIVEDFVFTHGKLTLFQVQAANPYPQLRFSDQHPFVSRSGALRVDKIRVGDLDIDDATGSLRLTRNQIAVEQLDAGVRGGRLAGSCVVDWRGPASTAELRLRLSGIQATHGGATERFDGNAALSLALAQRNVDGRVEILRIGRQHLHDLLDEYDPHHRDGATNRIRKALALGYPDRAEVIFDRGFASLKVAFGGLARLVKVSEVHGIPTGPIVERYLGPLFSLEAP